MPGNGQTQLDVLPQTLSLLPFCSIQLTVPARRASCVTPATEVITTPAAGLPLQQRHWGGAPKLCQVFRQSQWTVQRVEILQQR